MAEYLRIKGVALELHPQVGGGYFLDDADEASLCRILVRDERERCAKVAETEAAMANRDYQGHRERRNMELCHGRDVGSRE